MTDLSALFPYLAGILLSLVFAYVPGLESWYQALTSTLKRVVMLVLLALVAVGYVALACSPFGAQFSLPAEACTQTGFVAIVQAFIAAVIANQATYLLATPSK
jgi:hypothetical protein